MAQIIILEGPDGAGKTTLADALRNVNSPLSSRIVHHGKPAKGEKVFDTYVEALTAAARDKQFDLVVFDRLHLGEYIYGTHVRRKPQFGQMGVDLIDRYVHGLGAQMVLCLPPWRAARAVWLGRPEYVTDLKTFMNVYDAYAEMLFRDRRPYLRYDYTRHNTAAFARGLAQLEPRGLPSGLVGSPWPRFLFVGERTNGPHDLPFMALNGCSAWLYDALQEAGFAEDDCAFVNALGADGKPNRDPLVNPSGGSNYLEKLVGPNTVALGKVAHEWLSGHGIGHHELEHPQYWKRFKTSKREEFVTRLRAIRRLVR